MIHLEAQRVQLTKHVFGMRFDAAARACLALAEYD